jgi:xyloglucan-specific exo-beta-1,4-glucanase
MTNRKQLIALSAILVGLLAGCSGISTLVDGSVSSDGGSSDGGSSDGGSSDGGSSDGGSSDGGSADGSSFDGGSFDGSSSDGSSSDGSSSDGSSSDGSSSDGSSSDGSSSDGSSSDGGSSDGGAEGTPVGTSWTSVKIGGGGYVPGLIFHPMSANVLYARTDIGGAYRWNASTSSWVGITDGFGPSEGFYMGAESIALDPNDDQRVFMSTGMYNSADGSGRLYISADRGDHWQHVDLPFSVGSNNGGRAMGERMALDPNLPSTLFYGSRTAGAWKSTDSGLTWTQLGGLSSTRMTADQINASEGSAKGVELVVLDTSTRGTGSATRTVYAGVAPDYASAAGLTFNLYRSTDGGTTWSGVATPVTGYHIPHMVRAADGLFYVVFTHGSGPGADGPAWLYQFDGTHWTLLRDSQPTQWTSFGFGGVSVYGSGPTTRIALGVTNSWGNWDGQPVVALSDDAGRTWREIASTTPHTPASTSFCGWIDDVEIDPADPNHILHVYGGGVWATQDASAAKPSWDFTIEGLEETAAVSIIAPPAGAPYLLLNSSMDVGLLVHTDLAQSPTLGPSGEVAFGGGMSADMAWSDPSYIAAIGATTHGSTVAGVYSTDAGRTWTAFPTNHPDALANQSGESNIAVMRRSCAVWAPANSVPYSTTDNGATWVVTDLPAIERMTVNRSYRVVADRMNANKVYAYDSGGAWWGSTGKLYYSTDGGRTFTRSAHPALSSLRANSYQTTSMAVNPYAEGDVWVADGNSLYHSVDSGVTWKKLDTMQSEWGANPTWKFPELFGANEVALGKAALGAAYSAAVYMVGTVGGVWGVYRSDDAGASWLRINDDRHQFGGIGLLAADQNVYGRVYASGGGRGLFYTQ